MSGIEFSHDIHKIRENTESTRTLDKEQDVMHIYTIIRDLKDPLKNKKKKPAREILKILTKLQKESKIITHLNFDTMTTKALSTYYHRWKIIYDRNTLATISVPV